MRHGAPRRRSELAVLNGAARARCPCGRSSRAATTTRCTTRTARFDFAPESTAASALVWQPYAACPPIHVVDQRRVHHEPDWYRNFRYDAERARPRLHRGPRLAGHLHVRPRRRGSGARMLRGRWSRCLRTRRRRRAHGDSTRARVDAARRVSLAAASRGRRLSRQARRRQDDRRRLSVVHRLGPRHVHRAARALPRHRPPRRRAATSCSSGRGASRKGMLPNRFPDAASAPEFNSVDASLWFVVAVHDLFDARSALRHDVAGSRSPRARRRGRRDPRPATRAGTRFGIRARRRRPARCRRAGRAAHVDGRQGRRLGRHAAHRQAGRGPGALAQRAVARRAPALDDGATLFDARRDAFAARFWNDAAGLPLRRRRRRSPAGHGRRDVPAEPDLRGRRPAARAGRARRGRDARSTSSRRGCWTPLGLRSLAPGEPGYIGHYGGGVAARDGAYHQGTVWPWLLSAFVEAWVRVRGRRRDGDARGARRVPRAAASASRRSRPRARLGDRRRRRPAHAPRLPVPGVVGRRSAAARADRPGTARPGT